MACIDKIVAKHFEGLNDSPDEHCAHSAYLSLDLGLMYVGHLMEGIYDRVVCGGGKIDPDEVAAYMTAVLSYLGTLGPSVDTLGAFFGSLAVKPANPADRAS